MLKHHSTYEIMRAEDVGLSRTNLVLGKHSGRHAFRERVKELGFDVGDAELNQLFEEFKALADKKKELFDGDIEADRKSTRLNSSHSQISYAVFCLKKKIKSAGNGSD